MLGSVIPVQSIIAVRTTVLREYLFQRIRRIVVQHAHTEEDFEPVIINKEGLQHARLGPMEKAIQQVRLVGVWKIYIMDVDAHSGAQSWQHLAVKIDDIATWPDRMGRIDKKQIALAESLIRRRPDTGQSRPESARGRLTAPSALQPC